MRPNSRHSLVSIPREHAARQFSNPWEKRLKKAIQITCIVVTLAASAFAKVALTAPQPGTSSGSPVHFVASASSDYGNTTSSMIVYIDGVNKYLTYSNKVDAYIAMSSGWRQVIIKSWDSKGNIAQAGPYGVYVGGSSSGGGGGTPSTGTGTTFNNIEQMSGWGSCT